MHIPNGLLSVGVSVSTGAISVASVGAALKKTTITENRDMIRIGMVGAFIFAAQMLNFPVGPGVSGHLIGGVLALLLLGRAKGILVMTSVVICQCLFFQDGGLTALGANILNLAVIPIVTGSLALGWQKFGKRMNEADTAFSMLQICGAGLLSVIASAFALCIQLALSGVVPFMIVTPLMMFWHVVIGLIEGVLTAFAYRRINVPVYRQAASS